MNIEEMNKEDVVDQINYYAENIDTAQIDIMFAQKTQSRLNKYKTLMFACREKDIDDMVGETINNMKEHLESKEFDKYDLEVSVDDVVQVIEKDKVDNHEQIISKITLNLSC